ncbi:MAG: hypothetical protein GY731_12265 [Gammaproteobacteria bacterium]|nr:hypothetical protein [Gammaproteobacteria bacterium]
MKINRRNAVNLYRVPGAGFCRSHARILAAALVLSQLPTMSGCASVITIAAQRAIMGAGVVSLATTGKGLSDHALDMVTRQDCRILDGLLREDREICVSPGSTITKNDFRGVFVASSEPAGQAPAPTQTASVAPDEPPSPTLNLQLAHAAGSPTETSTIQLDAATEGVDEAPITGSALQLDVALHPGTEQTQKSSRTIAKLSAILTVVH